MAMMTVARRLALLVLACTFVDARTEAESQDEACEVTRTQDPARSPSLLQVQAKGQPPALISTANNVRTCSYQLVGDQDGSQSCASLEGKMYISGRDASLDEAGYQQTAALCCHHEMSLFVRREIAQQGFDVCELSDLHGFVHWYDCDNDKKTYDEMKKEIAGVMTSNCPWLGHLPNCPKRDPEHCGIYGGCAGFQQGMTYMQWALGTPESAPLNDFGYRSVAFRCCHTDMEKFIRREIERQNFVVCDEGGLKGFVPWFDCLSDGQTYEKLKEGIVIGRSGLPPMCPWLGSVGEDCPPKGHNCPVVEVPEPAAHRRRTACR